MKIKNILKVIKNIIKMTFIQANILKIEDKTTSH